MVWSPISHRHGSHLRSDTDMTRHKIMYNLEPMYLTNKKRAYFYCGENMLREKRPSILVLRLCRSPVYNIYRNVCM